MTPFRDTSVVPVADRRTTRDFVELPFRLYRNDPLWVPPLRSDVRKLISRASNPFFKEAEIENFVALNDKGDPVGRIAAVIHADYNRRFGNEHAFFGLFESENDPEVASALLQRVEAWAAERGKSVVTGPYSYTSTQDAGLLIENLDQRKPLLLQTYNPAYYQSLLQHCGYGAAFTFSTFGRPTSGEVDGRVQRLADRIRRRHRITVRSATKKDLDGGFDEVRCLFNDSFAKNFEVAPISGPTFKFAIDAMRYFLDLEGIRIVEVDGVPSAFFVIVPDLNEVLSQMQGSVGLIDLIKLPRYRRNIRKGIVALIGSNLEYHGKGLGRILSDEIAQYARTRYSEIHTMWIDDRNPSSYVLALKGGMTRTKRYGVYRKNISAAPPSLSQAIRTTHE